jgi:hypothetical protein
VTRSGRTVKKHAYLENYALSSTSYSDDNPQSHSEMEGRSDRMEWRKAVKRRARKQNFEITELPKGRKPLDCKWVFSSKRNNNLYDLEIIGGMKNCGGVL